MTFHIPKCGFSNPANASGEDKWEHLGKYVVACGQWACTLGFMADAGLCGFCLFSNKTTTHPSGYYISMGTVIAAWWKYVVSGIGTKQ